MLSVFLSEILFDFIPVHVSWSVGHEHDYETRSTKDDLCVYIFDTLCFYTCPCPLGLRGISMMIKWKVQKMSFVFLSSIFFGFFTCPCLLVLGASAWLWNLKYKRCPLCFSLRFSLLYTSPFLLVSEESACFIKIGSTNNALCVFLFESVFFFTCFVCHIPLSIWSTKDALCVSLSDSLCFYTCPCLLVRGAWAWLAEGSWTSWSQPATDCRSCNRCWSRLKIHENLEKRLAVHMHKSSGTKDNKIREMLKQGNASRGL